MNESFVGCEPVDGYVVISTVGTIREGERISRILVREGLAACVNIIPRVKSIYSWKGKVCEEKEALLVIKTVRPRIDKIIKNIKALHTYEVPEILVFKAEKGEKSYLNWLRQTAQSQAKKVIDNK
jgi:periplasmic divalent cation tolerance protein